MSSRVIGLSTLFSAVLTLVGGSLTPAPCSAGEIEEWPLPEIAEPSGVVYHPARGTLFVVGDEGHVAEVDLEGRLVRVRWIGGDLEGITIDRRSGTLIAVRESDDAVVEIQPSDLSVVRTAKINRAYDGDPNYLRKGGDGVEGITFRPAGSDGSRGSFYVVNQYDPPVLAELEPAALDGQATELQISRAWPVQSPPLSGLVWDEMAEAFIVVSALWRSAYVISPSGQKLGSVRIPGFMQEGLARLPGGSFVIVQDTGGLIKWTPETDPFVAGAKHAGHEPSHALQTQEPRQ